MRGVLTFILVAASCAASAQDLSTRVTFTTRAARASKVLKELGEAGKVDLLASHDTEDEVLLISVHDVPLSEVMARIATVTSGSWQKQGPSYRLIADVVKRRQEERERQHVRVQAVKKAIEEYLPELKKRNEEWAKTTLRGAKSDDDKADAAREAIDMSLKEEVEATIVSLLLGIGPSDLAEMEPGDRVVYSTAPTRTQRSMAADAEPEIARFIGEYNEQIRGLPPTLTDDLKDEDEPLKYLHIGTVSKANLVATRSNDGGSPNNIAFQLNLYDAKGILLFVGSLYLSNRAAGAGTDAGQETDALPDQPSSIEFSPDSRALIALLKQKQWWRYHPKMEAELRKKLVRPDSYDPLSFLQTDELLALARAEQKPIVADLPDNLGDGFEDTPVSIPTLQSLRQDIKEASSLRSVPDDAFLTLTPASPAESRSNRLDRSALAELIHSAERKLVPSLDDFAEYALKAPNPDVNDLGDLYLLWFVPGIMNVTEDWNLLQFYGQMSPATRSTLGSSGKIAFGNLTSAERASLERILYGAGAELQLDRPSTDIDPARLVESDRVDELSDDYRGEPTEIAPDGLPAGGYLELNTEKAPAAFTVGEKYDAAPLAPLFDMKAMAMFSRLRAKHSSRLTGLDPTTPSLKVGEQEVLDFKIHLTPQVLISQSLEDFEFNPDAEVLSENEFTARFQQQLSEWTARLSQGRSQANTAKSIHP